MFKNAHATYAVIAASTALTMTMVGAAHAQQTITLGHTGDPGSLYALSAEEFANRANERLGDEYVVEVFGSSQLGDDTEMLQRLLSGTLDFAMPSTVMSSEVPEFALFEMPYLVRDRDHMMRIEDAMFWDELAPRAEEAGFKILAVWENGFRHITNNGSPVYGPEDLEGMRIRTPGSQWRLAMFEEYGANPSPMEFSEVFLALQTGVMDGQENPFAQIFTSRFYEVQDHLSLSRHIYTPLYLTTGASSWENFPEDIRDILEETARETQEYVYGTAARLEEELLEELRQTDIEIHEVDTDAFIEASGPVYDQFSEEVDGAAEMIEIAIELGQE